MSIEAIETDNRWTPPQNRGDSVVKTTPKEQGSTSDTLQITPSETTNTDIETLSKEEIVFTRLVAKGYTPTRAYRMAFETSKDLAYGTVRNKAMALMTKHDIVTEISTVKNTTAYLARLSEDRLEEILTEGDIHARGTRVPDVAMFMYDHANGKAKQSTEIISKSVSVNIDLTGTLIDTENK